MKESKNLMLEGKIMIKKCECHSKGKTCIQVIAEGDCIKERCKLFKKVLKILPKLIKIRTLEARGVIPSTVWDFSEKAMKSHKKRQEKAERWINEVLPKIEAHLGVYLKGRT